LIALAWASGSACSHRRRDAGRDTPVYLLDLRRPSDRRRARRFRAGRDAQLQRRLPPCVYDERPRLPVGLAVGAADQAPRACDSAHGLTGKERAITFGGSGIESHQRTGPHNGIALGAIHSVQTVCLPASEGVGPRVRIRLAPAASPLRTAHGRGFRPRSSFAPRNRP
jgi:hypothetical protein